MEGSVQTNRENNLLIKLSRKGLINRKGIRYFLFMLYLSLYKFLRNKYFQIKEFPSNLYIRKTNKLRVLVHINGGLGDALCARNLLASLRKICPKEKAEIYLCCKNKEIFETFFQKENLADYYISRGYFLYNFDLVLSGCTYLKYEKYNETKINSLLPQLLSIIKTGLKRQEEFSFFIKGDPYTDKLFTEKMISLNLNKINTPLFFAGFKREKPPLLFNIKTDETLNKHNLKNKRYIVIHYENCEKQISNYYPTRPWPKNNWESFIKHFKEIFPEILIVQISGSIALSEADLCLCGKTNLQELAQIINGAILFIGGEGAPAHLAGFLGKKSIILYGPSRAEFLAYPQNINLCAEVCTTCVWVTKNWRSACPLGYKTAPCMSNINPIQVLTEVKKLL